MKKIIALCICLALCSLCFAGCTDDFWDEVYITPEYKAYQAFAQGHKPGMTKQEIYDALGCPVGYFDLQNDYHAIPYEDREIFKNGLATDSSAEWVYECYKYKDPADPYRLEIIFDSEGKSEGVYLLMPPG